MDAKTFWRNVKKTANCWLWLRGGDPRGYGRVHFEGKSELTHRLAWTLKRGPIPVGLQILHRCDTPACVNPKHLFVGTQQDNMRDMNEKGRNWVWTRPDRRPIGDRNGSRIHPESRPRGDDHWTRQRPHLLARGDRNGARTKPERRARGSAHPNAKLSPDQVLKIRELVAGGTTRTDVAAMFGLSRSGVRRVVDFESYANVRPRSSP